MIYHKSFTLNNIWFVVSEKNLIKQSLALNVEIRTGGVKLSGETFCFCLSNFVFEILV